MSKFSSVLLVALVASGAVLCVRAAGGIKGQVQDSQRIPAAVKGPRAQQQYLPPPPPPPQPLALPPPPPPRPVAVKGPGQVTPVFSAIRVQPILPPPPPPAPIVQQQQEQEPEPSQQQELQQQQQQQELDPPAAAQEGAPAIAAPAVAAPAAAEEEANPRPEPYAFNYAFEAGDSATSGSSQREEQQDASGKVTGFYTLRGEDGRDRRVDYVADANGFRATISTNEMGTAPKDSADVDWNAQNPTDAQLRVAESATQAARLRALQNPQPAAASASSFAASKISSPRQNAASTQQQQYAAAPAQQQQVAAAAKGRPQQQQQQQPIAQQLQEPFEQIRQTELSARARKSRHAPFYLFTV